MLKHEEPNDSKSKIELNPLLNQQTVTSSIKVEKSSTLKRFYERCKVPLFVIITLVILILCVILIVRTNGVVETNPSQNKYDIDLTQKSATGPPLLPGIYLMNKAYNMFLAKQLYEQSGVDIIEYTFNGRYTSDISGETYEIPLEFRTIPNIVPSCDITSKVNNVHYSTSTSLLKEQVETSSHGFSATIDLEIGAEAKGISGSAKTQVEYGLMFGHSSTSRNARLESKSGFTYSFSVDALNTYYKAAIDWNDQEELIFSWRQDFMQAIEELSSNLTNKSILLFVHKFGSHVLTKMQTGSYCRETAYMRSTSTQTDVEEFRKEVSSQSFNWGFWSSDETQEEKERRSGTTKNKVEYQFADIYCVGEIKVTTKSCEGLTADSNNPVITSFELLPIWKIQYIAEKLGMEAVTHIELFFDYILESLAVCRAEYCSSNGVCTLDNEIWSDSFITAWDGNFSSLWNSYGNEYCFCVDGLLGADCDQGRQCDCFGTAECCCNEFNKCNSTNLCSSAEGICLPQNGKTECGKDGQFINCVSGVVYGLCGSGGGDNCAKKSRLCPADSYGGIFCGYPELGQVETITSGWQCSNYGVEMSCEKDIHGGNLMVGACNSGGGANCKEHCLGFNGLQCAKMEGVIIDWKSCQWISSGDGEFARCANGYVGTGMCASGLAANCNGKWNEIQCCKFDYSFQKVLIDSNYSVSAL
eukprot:459050_1